MSAPTISYPLSNYDKIQKKKKPQNNSKAHLCVLGRKHVKVCTKEEYSDHSISPGMGDFILQHHNESPPPKKSQHQEPSDKNKGSINRCCNPPQSPDLDTMLSVRLRLAKSITYHNSPKILHEKFELLKNKYIN